MSPRPALLAVVVSLALAAAPPSASAQVAGEDQGVTAVRGSHGTVMRFGKRAASAYRRIAGRKVVVACSTVERVPGGFTVDGGTSGVVRAPKRRGRLRTLVGGRVDFCSVRLRGRGGGPSIAVAPVTADGRTYLDEQRTVGYLDVPFVIDDPRGAAPMPIAEMVAKGKGLVVALDGPDGTPPAEKVGYWTDGVRVVTAAVTRQGRRLFLELAGDVVRTNVLPYLTAP